MKVEVKDYRVEISKLTKEDGGGYLAHIPELDCFGDGATIEAAIKDVYDVADDLIKFAIEDGKEIPRPQYYKEMDEFSGKLSLRITKTLHKLLYQRAKIEECSINQLITTYVSMGLGDAFGKEESLFSRESNDLELTSLVYSLWQNMRDQKPKNIMGNLNWGNYITITNKGVRSYE